MPVIKLEKVKNRSSVIEFLIYFEVWMNPVQYFRIWDSCVNPWTVSISASVTPTCYTINHPCSLMKTWQWTTRITLNSLIKTFLVQNFSIEFRGLKLDLLLVTNLDRYRHHRPFRQHTFESNLGRHRWAIGYNALWGFQPITDNKFSKSVFTAESRKP